MEKKDVKELTRDTTEQFTKSQQSIFEENVVNIENGERIVPATVVIPAGEGPFPSVVINHGHGGNREENGGLGSIAEALANQGILSIRMDFPGSGDNTEPFTENYISNMRSDSNKCLEFILKHYNIDRDRLGILGYSMGGRLALLIASEENNPYKALGLLAPAASPGDDLLKGLLGGKENVDLYYEEAKSEKGYADYKTIYGEEQQLSKKWFDEIIKLNPLANFSNFTGNILVLYGDKDDVITPEVNELVLKAYDKATGFMIPNADHGYGFYSNQPDVTKLVEGKLTEFFVKNLKR